MTYSELITIITESSQLDQEQPVARSYESQLYHLLTAPKPLKAITGIRRSGKSFLLKKQTNLPHFKFVTNYMMPM